MLVALIVNDLRLIDVGIECASGGSMKQKHYMIFNAKTGELLGSMPFKDAQGCYGVHHIAMRITARGKPAVRWLCSGLDANAEENEQCLAIIRKHNNGNLPR